jgi:hypothetical protein
MAIMLEPFGMPDAFVLIEVDGALKRDPYAADLLLDRQIALAKLKEQSKQ